MLHDIIACAAGFLGLAILLGLRRLRGILRRLFVTGMGKHPFETRPVMNRGEAALYRKLLELAPRGTWVLPQVQMSAFIDVKGMKDRRERWKYLSQIIRLSVDFLIVDGRSLQALVTIELDGPSHDARRAFASGKMDADARKNRALRSAGVPLIRIPVAPRPDTETLRQLLQSALAR